jgi:hypothetical protein
MFLLENSSNNDFLLDVLLLIPVPRSSKMAATTLKDGATVAFPQVNNVFPSGVFKLTALRYSDTGRQLPDVLASRKFSRCVYVLISES